MTNALVAIRASRRNTRRISSTALPATLLLIESGNYQDFENTWTAIENATTVPTDLITEMTALAESCNLPEVFVGIFAA